MGALVVAALAFLYSMVAIIGAGHEAVYWGFVLLMSGLPIYVAMTWRKSPTG
jgi:APA family basic amino acid/polyamine antiporter